jgi:hypothetical protein
MSALPGIWLMKPAWYNQHVQQLYQAEVQVVVVGLENEQEPQDMKEGEEMGMYMSQASLVLEHY